MKSNNFEPLGGPATGQFIIQVMVDFVVHLIMFNIIAVNGKCLLLVEHSETVQTSPMASIQTWKHIASPTIPVTMAISSDIRCVLQVIKT